MNIMYIFSMTISLITALCTCCQLRLNSIFKLAFFNLYKPAFHVQRWHSFSLYIFRSRISWGCYFMVMEVMFVVMLLVIGVLTHRGLNNMESILQATFWEWFLKWKILCYCILIHIPCLFAHEGPIDNKPALIKAWHHTEDKPCLNQCRLSSMIQYRFTTRPQWIECWL